MNSTTIKGQLYALVFLFLVSSCTKIEYTNLGRDLIPVVDNINTFETVLKVIGNNQLPVDSTRLNSAGDHGVGAITTDGQFGSTTATTFFEIKPNSYKYTFAPVDSVIILDSAVMILSYRGYYGDSSNVLNFKLYEVNEKMLADTSAKPIYNLQPALTVNRGKLWGEKSMSAIRYADSIQIKRGDTIHKTVTGQLRIPLTQAMARALFYADTLGTSPLVSDSLFKEYLPGFALEASGSPSAIHYFNLNSSSIEFYFRNIRKGNIRDTSSASFSFAGHCAHAMKLDRNRAGANMNNFLAQNTTDGVQELFVQSAPGPFATLNIPGLDTLSNCVIHRAEIRVTQLGVPNGAEAQLVPPPALYVDLVDTSNTFKGMPFDQSPFIPYNCVPADDINFSYFGGFTNYEIVNGEKLAVYRFNISRYVQDIVSRGSKNYPLRIWAPYYRVYANCLQTSLSYPSDVFPFTFNNSFINAVGRGRVKLAGGNHPDPSMKLQLRIIYSRL